MSFWQRSDVSHLAFGVIFNGFKPLVNMGNLFGKKSNFSINYIQLFEISNS